MRRSGTVKYPHSVQLFKFCQKVLIDKKGGKVHDQEVGAILNFNPSDCSHWKRGEKNVKSVFALAKLADTLQVEGALIQDIASGIETLDEAFYEYSESKAYRNSVSHAVDAGEEITKECRKRVEAFIAELHKQSEFNTPPLYLPEVMRFFSFVSVQPADMMDRLSRVLRIRPGQYAIQYRKGELKPPTRMSMTRDLARIIFEGERSRFPELGPVNKQLLQFEQMIFTSGLLVPKHLLLQEMGRLDFRRNIISELANQFWVPKSLIGFQLQDMLRAGDRPRASETSNRLREVPENASSL